MKYFTATERLTKREELLNCSTSHLEELTSILKRKTESKEEYVNRMLEKYRGCFFTYELIKVKEGKIHKSSIIFSDYKPVKNKTTYFHLLKCVFSYLITIIAFISFFFCLDMSLEIIVYYDMLMFSMHGYLISYYYKKKKRNSL